MSGLVKLKLPLGGSKTISAPDSASDETITLPAGTKTLATVENFTSTGIDDNATTNTLSISNNLLKIKNGDGLNIQLAKGTRFGYSSAYRVLQLGSGGGGNNETLSLNYDPSGNPSGSFSGTGNEVLMKNTTRFLTPNTSNNGFHGVMDFVDGYVLTPNQPSFRVKGTGGHTAFPAGVFDFGYAEHNTGNHFSLSNNRFTAPVTGTYLFTASFNFYGPGSGSTSWMIRKNASHAVVMGDQDMTQGGWQTTTISGIIPLSTNDYIDVHLNGSLFIASANWTFFSGHLIG